MIQEILIQYVPHISHLERIDNAAVFEVPTSEIEKVASDLRNSKKLSLKLITATDERKQHGCFKIWYVFGIPRENTFIIPYIRLTNDHNFPSIASVFHQAIQYEKRICTFFGLTPVGHPDLRPLILHENWPSHVFPLRKDFNGSTRPIEAHGKYEFQKVRGEGIYEIPVGPIHAGIIEPGHFRFSVAGEEIVFLEPRLGYAHKGSEKLFEILSLNDKVRLSEKISGDSSFSHSLAFCQGIEQLSNTVVPQRALYLRVIYAELERLANHFGDIGAIMLDAGFNFGGAQGTRLRESIMRISERLTGSRFLRGVNKVCGVTKDIPIGEVHILSRNLETIAKDFSEIMEVAEKSTSLLNRLRGTGILSHALVNDRGVLGVAAKAAGMANDARVDFSYAAYKDLHFDRIETEQDGDVNARFRVRVNEVRTSFELIQKALHNFSDGPVIAPSQNRELKKNALAVSIVEGWRGEIVYFLTTDSNGSISRVVPRDPSIVNWPSLRDAVFNNVVPDFPLINKSFNFSYSGNDL